MNKKSKVGPYVVYRIQLVMFNNHFHTHLAPCRHANKVSNIPVGCFLNNLMELLIPVFDFCNAATGFIKCLKPERAVLRQYSAKVSCKPTRLSFLKISGSAQ